MTRFNLLPADQIPFHDFTRILNRTYADYYVPLDMSVSELKNRVLQDNIDLSASRVALDGDKLVGLGMLAQRGTRGWIGGLGVLPAYRRRGIGRQIMESLLESAQQSGIQDVQLEVIDKNDRAYALYRSLGFKDHRTLHVAEGRNHHWPEINVTIKPVSVESALAYYDAFHPVSNPWQRELAVLRALQVVLRAFAATENGRIVAYALGVFRDDAVRYVDLAGDDHSKGAIHALVQYLHRQHPYAIGSIINIAAEDRAWAVLSNAGYQSVLKQTEMRLKL